MVEGMILRWRTGGLLIPGSLTDALLSQIHTDTYRGPYGRANLCLHCPEGSISPIQHLLLNRRQGCGEIDRGGGFWPNTFDWHYVMIRSSKFGIKKGPRPDFFGKLC